MYKCDKCGCEHTSRTTCPKCGAPVILVNEDYLKRRREWEERQKNGGAAQPGNIAERTVAAVLGQQAEQTQSGRMTAGAEHDTAPKGGNGAKNRVLGIKRKIVSAFKKVQGGIRDKAEGIKKSAERKRRRAGSGPEPEMDDEDEMACYEKMLLAHVKFKSRLKKRILIGTGIAAAAAGVITAVCIAVNRDRSDVVYFNGQELVSAAKGNLEDFSKWGIRRVKAYSDGLNAMLFEGDNALMGWYEGREQELKLNGSLTDQYLFSESGRYAAYVSCAEPDGCYYLALADLKEQSAVIYESGDMLDLEALTDDGKVVYMVLDTTEYSIVVSRDLYVADKSGTYRIGASVSEAVYNRQKGAVLFLTEGNLYLCSIEKENPSAENGITSPKRHILVAEDVLAIAENKAGGEILYLTEEGLWKYNKESSFLASGVDSACSFYLLKNGKLYYRRLNTMYKAADGVSEVVAENILGDILCDEDGEGIIWLEKGGNLYGLNKKAVVLESGIDSIAPLFGLKGCAAVKGGELVCVGKSGRGYHTSKVAEYAVAEGNAPALYASRGFWYYADADGVMWKISERDSSRISLGHALIAAYRE